MNLSNTLVIYAATELRRPLLNEPGRQKTVCVDFDGVLSESSGPYAPDHFGPPISEGIKLLRILLDKGYDVKILTARKETDLVANWLREHGFPGMFVTNRKIPAVAYIDDRAISFADDSKAEDILKYVEDPAATLRLKASMSITSTPIWILASSPEYVSYVQEWEGN